MKCFTLVASLSLAFTSTLLAQDIRIGGPESAPLTRPIDQPGTDGDLWNQGGFNGVSGFSNGLEDIIGQRRTLLFDFVVPPDQDWSIDGLRWQHSWDTLPPGSGNGLEIRIYSESENGPGSPITPVLISTSYNETATGNFVFGRAEANSEAGFEPQVLAPGTYWVDVTIRGSENNYWNSADIRNGTELWVDYRDLGGLQPGHNVFGSREDMVGIVLGTRDFGYTCELRGDCPGRLTMSWGGARPNSTQALLLGRTEGETTLPPGPCEGTVLGIARRIVLVATFNSGNGSGRLERNAGPAACGAYLQLITAGTCETSTVASIP